MRNLLNFNHNFFFAVVLMRTEVFCRAALMDSMVLYS